MASTVYKWLVITISPAILFFHDSSYQQDRLFPLQASPSPSLWRPKGVGGFHPFHVSVVEVNHNAADKTFEISCKIFTDDLEKVLAQNYKTRVDLINPPNKAA